MASAQDNDYQEWRMIIVAGQILVEPERREAYLQSCVEVGAGAQRTPSLGLRADRGPRHP